jgi:hypothetical protein
VTHPGCRISRVRSKNSALAEIILLKPRSDLIRETLAAWARDLTESPVASNGIAGFAFMIWNADREISVASQAWEGSPNWTEIPDFVRAALVRDVARKTAEKVVREFHGVPADDPA